MILTTEWLQHILDQSLWFPPGAIQVYIEPGVVVTMEHSPTGGWIVAIRHRIEELPVNGTKNYVPPDWVPDYFKHDDEE